MVCIGGQGMCWDWANKNWWKRLLELFKKLISQCFLKRVSLSPTSGRSKVALGQVEKKTNWGNFGTYFAPRLTGIPHTVCAASAQLILKMLLESEEDKGRWRTDLSALNLRHGMHTYELLNHELDQYLWGQNADEDLEQSSRLVSLITSLLRSFQATWTYLMCSL